MLQCFVRGCKHTSSYHRRHFFKGQTVQKLGERRQWFPLNRFCVQKLIKNRLVRKPDDTEHRVVKKSRCTIEPEQSCSCVKKSKQRRWSGHDCTSRVVVWWVDYPTCQVLAHSMNSSCSVRGVDCEHHKDGEVVNQQIYSTDWAKSHTKEVFSRRPEAGGDIRQLLKRPGEEIRSRSVQTMLDTRLLQNAAGPSFRSSC